jgi:hypothetical protein
MTMCLFRRDEMTLVVSNQDHPAESTHWYTSDGVPAYQVMGKSGNMRNTTLRDARTSNLVPSVTTIIKSAASPGLEVWKMEQMLLAALTLPRIEGEAEKDFLSRVRHDSKEQGRMAAERGTAIHASVEGYYKGNGSGAHPEHIWGVRREIEARYGFKNWITERAFASDLGFGGKTDLACEAAVLDIKTKEFGIDNLPKGFDEQLMQLAAYRVGLGVPKSRCANVFVSVTNPGLVHVVEWSEEDLAKGWKMFCGLLDYWYAKTGLVRLIGETK